MPKEQIVWKKKAEAEDYAGARSFLSLIFSDAKAKKLLAALHKAKNIEYAAKDLLRASNLPLLPRDEPHVDEDLKRIHKSKPLAPLLHSRRHVQRRSAHRSGRLSSDLRDLLFRRKRPDPLPHGERG
jgi:hypothetical protein